MSTPIERREIVFSRAVRWLLAIGAIALVLYWLRAVLTPLLLAFTIAYILDPVVDRFEASKLPRPAGIAIVLGGVLAAIALFLALVLPTIAMDIASVAGELPSHAATGLAFLEETLGKYGVTLPHSVAELVQRFGSELQSAAATLVASASGALYWIIGSTASVIGSFVAALIVPVFAIYLLNDFDRITQGVHALLPLRLREPVASYARQIDGVLSQFLRGQLTVMLVLSVLYGGTYAALGIRLAVPIGIAAGVLNIVPYLGSAFALLAGAGMALIDGWQPGKLIGVVVAYTVIQTLEGFVITPRIMGKTVGLRDVWILLALFVGGEIFGFLGVLIAVPAAAIAKIFVTRWLEHYRRSELFLTPPAPPPPS
jgi:predicted PurR-regulated permease PerM